jgi:hypothetical protein
MRTHVPRSDFGRVGREVEVGFERRRQLWASMVDDVANPDVANLDFGDVDVQGTGTGLGLGVG